MRLPLLWRQAATLDVPLVGTADHFASQKRWTSLPLDHLFYQE